MTSSSLRAPDALELGRCLHAAVRGDRPPVHLECDPLTAQPVRQAHPHDDLVACILVTTPSTSS